jgi:hypothetical protein
LRVSACFFSVDVLETIGKTLKGLRLRRIRNRVSPYTIFSSPVPSCSHPTATDNDKGYGVTDTVNSYSPSKAAAELDSQNTSPRETGGENSQWTDSQMHRPQMYQAPIVSELPADSHARHMSLTSNLSDQSTARLTDVSGFSPSIPQGPYHSPEIHVAPSAVAAPFGADAASVTPTSTSPVPAMAQAVNMNNAQTLREQQNRIRDERARLTRLQELSEMEARLERQLQEEMERDRP